VQRDIGQGWEIVEAKLPVLMTVIDTANQPRPCSAKRVMRHKRARAVSELAGEARADMPDASDDQRAAEVEQRRQRLAELGLLIEQWDLDAIGAELDRCGIAGSPTKVHRVQSIVLTKEGFTEVPPTEEGVGQMIHELVVDRTWG